ncbi:MAG: hypothetical protein RIR26_2020 [Pseudomonadota bacterium]
MANGPAQRSQGDFSYQLYCELLEELLEPIEPTLDLNTRYELYQSKLIYLENLQEQCFRSVNRNSNGHSQMHDDFTSQDLQTIKTAITSTHAFMRSTILEALNLRLAQIGLQDTRP